MVTLNSDEFNARCMLLAIYKYNVLGVCEIGHNVFLYKQYFNKAYTSLVNYKRRDKRRDKRTHLNTARP